MKKGIFVSGTDTNVGKTFVSSLLVSALRSSGLKAGYFKPVQTGSDSDTQTVSEYCGISLNEFPQPTYSFREPMAPSRAAQREGHEIQIDHILKHWKSLDDRHWIVEGAGGLLVPLNSKLTIRDLIQALNLSLILVSSTRLGTINHTLLSLEAASSLNIPVRGIILNGNDDLELEQFFWEFTKVPVLARVPTISSVNPMDIQELAKNLFSNENLKSIYE